MSFPYFPCRSSQQTVIEAKEEDLHQAQEDQAQEEEGTERKLREV